MSVYQPHDVEAKWTKVWRDRNIFHANSASGKTPFSMVIPPPNITGSLHMGHALNNTIQDILIRWKHMQGCETCWFPGTDHAGIATQVVVERELRKENLSRFDLGREKFVERVWKWKEEYGGIIDDQLRKLGVSCDWERYSFTMDESRSSAVIEAFVRLYEKGIIYRDRYIVNWCPRCQTALSDLEVEHSESDAIGVIYHLRYPLKDDPSQSITVATVRPETMLGDVAVAVHPEDPRFRNLIGKKAVLPLVGRLLPILADEWADPSVGSGAVKITPAHDPNDFEVSLRHHLEPLVVIDPEGKMTMLEATQGERGTSINREFIKKYHGLDRFDCRKEILKDLEENGYLVKQEPWPSNPGRCARSGDIIEPYLSVQWFAKMKDLAAPAIQAVRQKEIEFHPDRFSKLYFDWMENIRDWCISRQLWWGHRIPAWYCLNCDKSIVESGVDHHTILPDAKPMVKLKKPASCDKCGSSNFIQDPDVLDTWFSSALWPLSVMGWPKETGELEKFYPTTVLSTGRDIIFLWVARMIMMGLEFRKKVPFYHVSIHPTILDREGKRMSKSKGTGIDPLKLIEKYGADATRFGIILMAQGQDVRFHEEKIEQARNFVNKIWNASRYVLSTLSGLKPDLRNWRQHDLQLTFYDRWILYKLSILVQSVNEDLSAYQFSSAASRLYDFVWDDFCDWYLELCKLGLQREKGERKAIAASILVHLLSQVLKLLHPFIPFLTEEIWDQMNPKATLLLEQPWPVAAKEFLEKPDPLMESFMGVVKAIRNLRAEIGLKPKDRCSVLIRTGNPLVYKQMEAELLFLAGISNLTLLENKEAPPKKALSAHLDDGAVYLSLEGMEQIAAEVERLKSDREKSLRELQSVEKLLHDPAFTGKAKSEIIEKTLEKERLLRQKLERINERIALLS